MSQLPANARGKAPGRRHPSVPRWLRLVVLVVSMTFAVGTALAYMGTTSVPGGAGAGAATTVNKGNTPTASVANGSTVTVTWLPSTTLSGVAVSGYVVKRYDASTRAPQTILSNCTGSIATTSCTENNVPGGSWIYTVTPLIGTNWAGAESDPSAPVSTDSTAPINNISLILGSGAAVLSGNTVYYNGSAAGSFTLRNAVADSGSGPASSATATLNLGGSGWSHGPSLVSTPAGGPFVSTVFSWSAGTSSSPTEAITGRDKAGNSATTTLTFLNDSTGPTGGSVTVTGLQGTGTLYSVSTSIHLTLAKGSDLNGLATSGEKLYRASASLTSTAGANGVCGSFGSYSLLATDPATPYTDPVTDAACYTYQYVVSDGLGNATTYTSASTKVDTTAPSTPTSSFGSLVNAYFADATGTLYYNSSTSGSISGTMTSTDAASGIATYNFPDLGIGWTKTAANGTATYSWTPNPANPGAKSVTTTNNAGLTSAPVTYVLTPDATGPAGVSLSYANSLQRSTTISVPFNNGTDAGSGIGTRLVQRATAPLTNGACGTYSSYSTVATNPAASPYTETVAKGYCYKYQYVVSDNVGNTSTYTGANVVIVTGSYYDTIMGTSSLLNYWRLGEASGSTMADSYGAISGTYAYSGWPYTRPTLGVTGAISGDSNTAVSFNGISQYGTVTKTLGGDFSIEFWFRSTQGISTSGNWWDGAGLVDASSDTYGNDWGITLRSDGRLLFGDSNIDSNATLISTSGGYDDGNWHQVVATRKQSTGLLSLYVDGAAVGTYTGTTAALNSPTINFGRVATATNYFAGSLDDISFYGTVLAANTISVHYAAGH